MQTTLRVELLGKFAITIDAQPALNGASPRMQSLLAALALNRQHAFSRGQLAFLLWPETSDAQAHTNLRNLLFWLRRTYPQAAQLLCVKRESITWKEHLTFDLDVERFLRLFEQADAAERTGNWALCYNRIEQAEALYAGDLLCDCYEDWIVPERERLRQLRENGLWRMVKHLDVQGDFPRAIAYAQTLLQDDPISENVYRLLMHLYARSGQPAAAAHVYRQCEQALQSELSITPSIETQKLNETILSIQDSLPGGRERGWSAHMGAQHLAGRDTEWGAVIQSWWRAALGDTHLLLLEAEPGLGRTRLLRELQDWAEGQKIPCAWASCQPLSSKLALAPLAEWLAKYGLTAHVEKGAMQGEDDLESGLRCLQVFEQLAEGMLRQDGLKLLFIDDLNWCDALTLMWLEYILQHHRSARFLIAAAACPPGMIDNPALAKFLAALAMEKRLAQVELRPLSLEQTGQVCDALGWAGDDGQRQALFDYSEGWPVWIVDYIEQHAPGARQDAPQTAAQASIAMRMEQLSPFSRDLAGLGSLLGREFGYGPLQQASQLDPAHLAGGLDELVRSRVLLDLSGGRYRFGHVQLHLAFERQVSDARQHAIHSLRAHKFLPNH